MVALYISSAGLFTEASVRCAAMAAGPICRPYCNVLAKVHRNRQTAKPDYSDEVEVHVFRNGRTEAPNFSFLQSSGIVQSSGALAAAQAH